MAASYTPVSTKELSPEAQKARAESPSLEIEDEAEDGPGPSTCFLIALNSFAFSYSLVVATLGVVILPSEAIHLFSDSHAMMLGVMLGCTGVTQLLGPAVGYNSDRSTSQYGRRRPMLVVGAIVACCGCIAMRFAREYKLQYTYLGALTSAIAGLNIRCVCSRHAPLFPFSHTRASPRSYACYTALLPDLVPSAHLGRASGTMATMSMLCALLGFGLFGFWLSILHAYTIYCVVIILTVSLTCVTAREKKRDESPAFSYSELVAAYSIDVVAHSDFFWVFFYS